MPGVFATVSMAAKTTFDLRVRFRNRVSLNQESMSILFSLVTRWLCSRWRFSCTLLSSQVFMSDDQVGLTNKHLPKETPVTISISLRSQKCSFHGLSRACLSIAGSKYDCRSSSVFCGPARRRAYRRLRCRCWPRMLCLRCRSGVLMKVEELKEVCGVGIEAMESQEVCAVLERTRLKNCGKVVQPESESRDRVSWTEWEESSWEDQRWA